ncbi:hypothetical protein L3X38_043165 [Prunus dulcis]|uniref:Transposable element protein n=1 Tax=Prunus dulcis TaxID=3755 RepID=A0AAD4YM86_PRUDU|nr:hypothetical protein L3X38_043165 [Prunus dulcis]
MSTSRYPQGSGQLETFNNIVLDCLKKGLEGAEEKWIDELPELLWAYRTTKRRSIDKIPYSLAYKSEAIIHLHIYVPSICIEVGSIGQNSKQMKVNIDLLEGE